MVLSDQVLDEITELAAVEHAVIAEYLQIAYVLGHGLPEPAPGPAGSAVAEAAEKILNLAMFTEMRHLKLINELLVASGRPAQLGQAVGVDHGLGASLNHPDEELSSSLLSSAITSMDTLDQFNAQLVARGLLPDLRSPAGSAASGHAATP